MICCEGDAVVSILTPVLNPRRFCLVVRRNILSSSLSSGLPEGCHGDPAERVGATKESFQPNDLGWPGFL